MSGVEPRQRDGSTPEELRLWVDEILVREQLAGAYGSVVVYMESGRILRIETKRTEKPPKPLLPA